MVGALRRRPYNEGMVSSAGQYKWGVWVLKWHWDSLLSEYFAFPCHYHFTALHTHQSNCHLTLVTDSDLK